MVASSGRGTDLTVALFGAAIGDRHRSGPKEVGGTLVGAGAGAADRQRHRRRGRQPRAPARFAGAAIGGLIGNRIGAAMDDEDKRRAYAAQVQALESGPSGAPVAWRNPDSGRYGSVVPGPAYQSNRHELPAVHPHDLYRRAGRRPRAAPPAAIRTAPGRRWDRRSSVRQ